MPDLNIMRIDETSRRVTWGLNLLPARNTGIELLVQLCAKTILTTSGQDYLRPEYGGSILALSGRTLNSNDIPRLNADIAYIVRSSEEQIMREQVAKPINAHERLKALTLLGIEINMLEGEIIINTLCENESGEVSRFSFDASMRL